MESIYHVIYIFFTDVLNKTMHIFMIDFFKMMCVCLKSKLSG